MLTAFASLAPLLLPATPLVGDPIITLVAESGQSTTSGLTVKYILDSTINNLGQWLVTCDLTPSPIKSDIVLSSFGELFIPGTPQPVIPGGILTSVTNTMQLADDGTVAALIAIDDPAILPSSYGISIGAQLHFPKDSQVAVTNIPNPVTLVGPGWPAVISADRMLVHADTTEPGSLSGAKGMIFDVQMDPTSHAIISTTAVVQEGDAIADARLYGILQTSLRTNASGQVAYQGYMRPNDSSLPLYTALVLDGQQVLAEGEFVPALGAVLTHITHFDINSSGQIAALVRADGVGRAIIVDQTEIIRQGAIVNNDPTMTLYQLYDQSIFLSDSGDVLWSGSVGLPTPVDSRRALFVNDTMLIREGVTVLDGQVASVLDLGQDGYEMSNDGRFVIFEARVVNNHFAAFKVDRFPPFANPIPGVNGLFSCKTLPATLEPHSGSIALGSSVTLTATGAQSPGAIAYLFIADALIAPPCGIDLGLAGSLLLSPAAPNPVVYLSKPTGGAPTNFTLAVPNWPILAGLTVYAQSAFLDATAPAVLTFTTGLELILGTQ